MPSEPKRPIEELLEASAKARRAEFKGEPRMPNPMRARLHEEIARLDRPEQSQPRRSWLAAFWPQVSLATAVAAVLVTTSILWSRHRLDSGGESRKLAMQPPPAAVPQDEVTPPVLQQFADVSLAPAAPTPAESEAGDTQAQTSGEIARSEPGEAAPASGQFANAASVAAVPALAKNERRQANLPQRFSQTARSQTLRDKADLKTASILDSFQVEQGGAEIRIVDADGSTYTGQLDRRVQQRPQESTEKKMSTAARADKPSSDAVESGNELFFRASGYNASLKKRVVFEGNYIAVPPNEQKSAARGRVDTQERAPARIVGKAKIPGEIPIEVDAVEVIR